MSNERSENSLSRRANRGDYADSRAIGQRAAQFLSELRSEYSGALFDQETQRSFGAEVAGAVSGNKPLYHEEWGISTSVALADQLRQWVPAGVEACAKEGHLYVYRTEGIEKIIADAPSSYPGKNLLDKIHRSTLEGTNGLLLGYGARSMTERGAVRVLVQDEHGVAVLGFNSMPDQADSAGATRALDYARFTGHPFTYRIVSVIA